MVDPVAFLILVCMATASPLGPPAGVQCTTASDGLGSTYYAEATSDATSTWTAPEPAPIFTTAMRSTAVASLIAYYGVTIAAQPVDEPAAAATWIALSPAIIIAPSLGLHRCCVSDPLLLRRHNCRHRR